MKISPNAPCPCTSGKKYKKCCRRYHNGMTITEPAELVRARFSAYALNLPKFIMLTTHPDSANVQQNVGKWMAEIKSYILRTEFQKLDIISVESLSDLESKVTYHADMLMFHTNPMIMVEEAILIKIANQWTYLTGEVEMRNPEETDSE